MANNPTVGIFLPGGYLNNFNSASDTGQVDAYGNVYPSGSNVGKMIEVGDALAKSLSAPGATAGSFATANPLYGGAYQIVLLDSGATAANCVYGNAAYIKLDSGPTAGALPETQYEAIAVTDGSHADSANLFAGVFINPATIGNGIANTPTPGNYILIFVGAGRATVNYNTIGSATGVGAPVNTNATSAGFTTSGATTTFNPNTIGVAVTTPVSNTTGVIYMDTIFYRIPAV